MTPTHHPTERSNRAAVRQSNALLRSRWFALAVLTLVGAFNWADRQVVPILFPGIRADLGLSDTQLGIIGGLAFSLIYAVSALAFGYAADRYLRTRIIVFGLVLWSAATAASGLATGFWSLFAARFFTGIGEATLYPCALSIIGERFSLHERGKAIGIYQASAAIGGGLGIGLGGALFARLGWRNVFFLYGGAGLLMIPFLLSLHESPRPTSTSAADSAGAALRDLLKDRRLRWLWGTGTLAIACGQGFGAWGPSYLVRELEYDVAAAGAVFGVAGLGGGILGGILGGFLADRCRRARLGGEFDVATGAALTAGAFLTVLLSAGHGPLTAASGIVATLAIYSLFPGVLSAMLSMVPAKRHGLGGAVNAILFGGVGAASGPFVVGAISDAQGSLHTALSVPTVGLFATAVIAAITGRIMRAQSEP